MRMSRQFKLLLGTRKLQERESSLWINKKTFLPSKVEYVNKQGKVYRRIETVKVDTDDAAVRIDHASWVGSVAHPARSDAVRPFCLHK